MKGSIFLSKYKVDIIGVDTNNLRVLKNSEMTPLFKDFQAGNKLAKEEIINGNYKLVLSIIKNTQVILN